MIWYQKISYGVRHPLFLLKWINYRKYKKEHIYWVFVFLIVSFGTLLLQSCPQKDRFCPSVLVCSFSLTLIWDGAFSWLCACHYALFLNLNIWSILTAPQFPFFPFLNKNLRPHLRHRENSLSLEASSSQSFRGAKVAPRSLNTPFSFMLKVCLTSQWDDKYACGNTCA